MGLRIDWSLLTYVDGPVALPHGFPDWLPSPSRCSGLLHDQTDVHAQRSVLLCISANSNACKKLHEEREGRRRAGTFEADASVARSKMIAPCSRATS